ncbi:MAG: BatA and WFA domain-containing protein [Phycisphaerales bacterium]|nr:BatA and WFA domain-containing protein [Phycisphaerales bacterium]
MTFAAPMLAGIVAAIAIPTLIILYFLKLRRIPREVSSTLLWKKTIQDLQANAPFQRLRKNLLLFLQLIVLGLIILALAQPRSATTTEQGKKYLILIDRSASMAAVDGTETLGSKSRLERAKEEAITLIESMREPSVFAQGQKADEAMIIAFDASAEIIEQFTSDQAALINAINSIEQTDAPSSIEEAYRLAQAQRPNRVVTDANEAGEVLNTIELEELKGGDPYFFHLYSDGRIPDIQSVRADQVEGQFAFEYHAMGTPTSNNIGLVALRSERDYDDPTKLSIFVGVQSTDTIERSVDAELIIDGITRSVRQIDLPAATIDDTTGQKTTATGGVVFELVEPNAVLARVRLDTNGNENPEADVLLTDNEGALIVPPAKQAAVALVSSGNLFVQSAISGFPLSKFEIMSPSEYEAKRDRGDMAVFDVVVLDSYLPRANEQGVRLEPGRYLILGKVLTGPMGVADNGVGPGGAIIDWRRTHPVLRDLTLDALLMAETPKIEIPKGSGVVSLAETAQGPAIFETSDTDVRAIVVPFDIARTNWPFDVSFVVFLASAVDYLGTGSVVTVDESARLIQPGSVLADRLPSDATGVRVQLPDGSRSPEIIPSADGRIVYGPIEQTGLYTLRWQGTPGPNDIVRENDVQRVFAANLLNPAESDVSTASTVSLANTVVSTESSTQRKRIMDWWPWLLMGALAILMFEWWVYNKKMYL